MAGESGRNRNMRVIRVQIQDEVIVRTVSEQAGLHRHSRAIRVGKITLNRFTQDRFIFGMALSIHSVGIDLFVAVMIFAELEAWNSEDREPIVSAHPVRFWSLHIEYRKCAQPK